MAKPSLFQRSVAFLLMLAGCATPQKQQPPGFIPPSTSSSKQNWVAAGERFAVYYDDKVDASSFLGYDTVVFDAEYHPNFTILQPRTTVLGYLSIGEVHGHSPHVNDLRVAGAIMSRNPKWDSYIVDPRNRAWRDLVLNQKIPAIVAAGFDGLMLDTIDSPLNLDASSAEDQAIYAASIQLIRDIRAQFPHMKIMVNRGFEILDPIAGSIDCALAESTFSKYEPDTRRKPEIWDHSAQRPIVEMLRRAKQKNPALKIYTLDYWDMNDVEGVQFVYQVQRMRGFIPYVATPDLRTNHAEPIVPPSSPSSLRG